MKYISHYTKNYNDPFRYKPSNSSEFVINDIKPAYALFLDSLNSHDISLNTYLDGEDFKKNYSNAKVIVEQYISDVYNKSTLTFISKVPLTVYVATYNNNKYVIKGEFVLRVINDFILNKINLNNLTYDDFKSFVVDNTEYWRDSIIELDETILSLPKTQPLSEYIHLLDRYETYDKSFLNNIRVAVDVFLF